MSPRTVQSTMLPASLPAGASCSNGLRMSMASRKISPAMMSPEMKYLPVW